MEGHEGSMIHYATTSRSLITRRIAARSFNALRHGEHFQGLTSITIMKNHISRAFAIPNKIGKSLPKAPFIIGK